MKTYNFLTQRREGAKFFQIGYNSTFISFLLFLLFISTQSVAQTSYTWNGGTSTDFATSTNWTPNGVPGSGDDITIVTGSNTCKLDGNRTVNKLTVTSGTLDLETYDLTMSYRISLTGGTVEDGKLIMTSSGNLSYFSNVTVDCELDIDAKTTLNGTNRFKQEVTLTDVRTWNNGHTFDKKTYIKLTQYNIFVGGNMYKDSTTIEAASAQGATQRIGYNTVDTFLAPVTFLLSADMQGFYLGDGTNGGVYCADDVTIHNSSPGTNDIIYVAHNGTSEFKGDITLLADSTSGDIAFYGGTAEHDGELLIGAGGYHSGTLHLYPCYQQQSAYDIDLTALDHNAKVTFGANLELEGSIDVAAVPTHINTDCHFKGDATFRKIEAWTGNTTVDGKANFTVTRYNVLVGGNVFKDSTEIHAASTSGYTLSLGVTNPDTFLAPVWLDLNSAVQTDLHIANSSAGNYFADDVILSISSTTTSDIRIGNSSSDSCLFKGDITLNVDSAAGNIIFNNGSNTHEGILKIGEEGYHSGQLNLSKYIQTGTGTIDLSDMDNTSSLRIWTGVDISANVTYPGVGNATLNGVIFRGDVNITSPSLPVTNCEFYGSTVLKKTGTSNNLNGGNKFHGATTIENASASNYLYWGNSNPDTILGDLTLINRGSQPLWMNYNTSCQLSGDLTLDGDSACVIRLGSNTAGRVAVFNGSTDQHLNILEDDLNVQLYRVEVNKSGGRLKLNNDGTVFYELKLTDGIIECSNDAILTLNNNVIPTASDSSYVEGKVKKIGDDAFDFPVGSNGHYRPISISAPSSTSDAFAARHINEDSDPSYEHDDKESSINEIGTNEYWLLDRDAGTSNVSVTLSWDDMSCGFDTLANLRIVAWDSAAEEWKDLGNGGTTGDTDEGTIVASGASTIYAAYAFGTIDEFDCVPCRADAGEDWNIYIGDSLQIGGTNPNGTSFSWEPTSGLSDATLENPKASPSSHQDYTLEVTNSEGCKAKDQMRVWVRRPPILPHCQAH